VPAALVQRVDDLGLLPREPDGSLGGAAARRVSLLAFALSRSVPTEVLAAALESYGDLFVSFGRPRLLCHHGNAACLHPAGRRMLRAPQDKEQR
jgi:hypothetical protein